MVEFASKLPGVAVARDYTYMCSDPGQNLIKDDIEKEGLNRVIVASCSPAHARAHLPQDAQGRRPQPLLPGDGQHPRAVLLGARGQRRGHREGQEAGRGGGGQGAACLEAARGERGRRDPVLPGHRRRDRRHPGRAGHRRRGLQGLPGREDAVRGRAHGPARQDLPHPRLLGLHPDPQDGGRGQPPQHRAHDLLPGRGDRRLRRQLQGQDPQEGALRRLRQVHRLRRLRRELPHGGAYPQRVRRGDRERAAPSTCRSRRRSRPSTPSTRSAACSSPRASAARKAPKCAEACQAKAHRLRAAGRDRGDRDRHDHRGHRLRRLRLRAASRSTAGRRTTTC